VLTAQNRHLPLIHGVIRTRSADARADAATSTSYYDIEVVLKADEQKKIENLRLLPGTPIEVIVPTGSRTVLGYLFEPISESFRRGLREK
jgi:hypothetical protein